MSKCNKCGAEIPAGTVFCAACGAKQEEDNSGSASGAASDIGGKINETISKLNDTTDSTADFDQSDIDSNKVMAVLSYLSWLVLIPIFGASKSKFARFHVNQGLVLAICEVIWNIAVAIVNGICYGVFGAISLVFIAQIISSVLKLGNLVFFIFSILGIINAVNGKAKQLPIIGQIELIK